MTNPVVKPQMPPTDRDFSWWLGLIAGILGILSFLGFQTYRQLLPVSFNAAEVPPSQAGNASAQASQQGPSYSHASPLQLDFYNEPACLLSNPRRFILKARAGIEVTAQFMTALPKSDQEEESLQLAFSVCNTSDQRKEYKPIYAWYTYFKPGVMGTVHWELGLSDPPSDRDFLSPRECEQVYLRTVDSLVQGGAAFLVEEPLGLLTLSNSRNRSSCILDLRQP